MPRTTPETLDRQLLIRRVQERIAARGTNAKAASKRARLGSTAVHDIISQKNKNPSVPVIRAIARALDTSVSYLTGETDNPDIAVRELAPVPVIGIAEAGAFRAMRDFNHDDSSDHVLPTISVPPSRRHPSARRFCLEVRGDSMNAAKPTPIVDGMFALCIDMIDAELSIESGRIYAIRRTLDGGQTYECTIKRAQIFRDRIELRPESTNARHQPLTIPRNHDPESATEVQAIGLVYGVYSPMEGDL